jgi:hypothetical protein
MFGSLNSFSHIALLCSPLFGIFLAESHSFIPQFTSALTDCILSRSWKLEAAYELASPASELEELTKNRDNVYFVKHSQVNGTFWWAFRCGILECGVHFLNIICKTSTV